jgi:hypothetical protein
VALTLANFHATAVLFIFNAQMKAAVFARRAELARHNITGLPPSWYIDLFH